MALHLLEQAQLVPRPRPEVFAFFADARNLERLTPPFLRFQILTPAPIELRPGALIDYRLSLFGLPFRWRTEIEAFDAARRMADGGCVIGNQMVLLKGINDDPRTVKDLNHKLLMMRIRPYYIYQCDLAKGISHFRTPIETGRRIIRSLRGHTSGMAVPYFVVDAPSGGGKIPVNPDYVVRHEGKRWVLRNFAGKEFTYDEP